MNHWIQPARNPQVLQKEISCASNKGKSVRLLLFQAQNFDRENCIKFVWNPADLVLSPSQEIKLYKTFLPPQRFKIVQLTFLAWIYNSFLLPAKQAELMKFSMSCGKSCQRLSLVSHTVWNYSNIQGRSVNSQPNVLNAVTTQQRLPLAMEHTSSSPHELWFPY